MRILGVGIATLDIINIVDHYPSEDEELRALNQLQKRGGNCANTLCVLSQFGHDCDWTGTVGSDSSANSVLEDLSSNHIDFTHCKVVENGKQPTSYITLNQLNGSRTIVHYRDLPELDFAHFQTIPLNGYNWIHFEARAIEETAAMVKFAKNQNPNTPISIEIEKPRDKLEIIYNLADVYLFSKAYASALNIQDPKLFLSSQRQNIIDSDLVTTWGEQGAYALLRDDTIIHNKAYPPEKTIDTIGAGDTFNAALIHSRLANKNWPDSLDLACQVAGKKCGQMGFQNLLTS